MLSDRIKQAIIAIHGNGIRHNALENPRNIVRDVDGNPRIVDFTHAQRIRCQRDHSLTEWGVEMPTSSEKGCEEIFEVLCRIGSFFPGASNLSRWTLTLLSIARSSDQAHDLNSIQGREAVRL